MYTETVLENNTPPQINHQLAQVGELRVQLLDLVAQLVVGAAELLEAVAALFDLGLERVLLLLLAVDARGEVGVLRLQRVDLLVELHHLSGGGK